MYLEIYNKTFGNLKLIPLNPNSTDDFSVYKEIISDPIVMKKGSLFNGKTTNDNRLLKKYFNTMTSTNITHNLGVGKLIDANNNLIGISGFGIIKMDENNNPEIVELIYFLKEKYWNKKIGYDVSLVLMDYLFSNFKSVNEVLGIACAINYPSQIIMLKLGFKFVGTFLKRGSVINYHTLNREIYKNHHLEKTEKYIKLLNNINSNINKKELEEIDSSII